MKFFISLSFLPPRSIVAFLEVSLSSSTLFRLAFFPQLTPFLDEDGRRTAAHLIRLRINLPQNDSSRHHDQCDCASIQYERHRCLRKPIRLRDC